MNKSEDTKYSENDNIDVSDLKLTEEMKETCNASPMEIVLYYITYPSLLLKDAYDSRMSAYDLLVKAWQNALEYCNKKYN